MANKIRKSLQDKIDIAYKAAAEKEGRETTDMLITYGEYEKISNDRSLVAYKSDWSCLLYDGRYIHQEEDVESRTFHWHIMDNVPVAVLKTLVGYDHDENVDNRKEDAYKDPEYEFYKAHEGDEQYDDGSLTDPIDREMFERQTRQRDDEKNYHMDPEEIFREGLIDPYKSTPEDIMVQLTSGDVKDYTGEDYPLITDDNPLVMPEVRMMQYGPYKVFEDETKFQLKRLMTTMYSTLDEKQQNDYRLIFGSGMKQREMAYFKGVTEQAISNRKRWFIKKGTEMAEQYGFGDLVPGKEELKKEKKERTAYEKHREKVEQEIQKEIMDEDMTESA